MYQENALSGVHPDDQEYVRKNLAQCIKEKREKGSLNRQIRSIQTEGHPKKYIKNSCCMRLEEI